MGCLVIPLILNYQIHRRYLWLTSLLCYSQEAVEELRQTNLDFLPFADLEKAVEDDVEFLKRSKLVDNSVLISGWVYEVETGKTRRVV
jgi:carbonic anhydrase